jgi:predicted transcriptional regulator
VAVTLAPRCETIGKYVLPIFRSLVAKELVKTYNLTQLETAKKLGTTQAAISQYINSKRAFKGAGHLNSVLPKIQAIAFETAKRLAEDEISADEVTLDFCKLCSTFGEELRGSSVCTIASLFSDYSI